MCISNWSSDVCSSVLDRLRGGKHRVPRRDRGRHRDDDAVAAVARDRFGEGLDFEAVRIGVGPPGVEDAVEIFQLQPIEIDHRHAAEAETGELFADDRARSGDRSEEHTSELQSLTRISYAVFCLKTNNKHT